MKEITTEEITDGVHLQRHPLSMAGCQLGRVVTVLRLNSGKTLIHSTAKFSPENVAAISKVGEPGWLLEATNFHDTQARDGRIAFPDIPYLVPPRFKNPTALDATEITGSESPWGDEIEVMELEGMPKLREHAIYHRASRTLVVADLLFNLPESAGAWTRTALRVVSGMKSFPGTSRLLRMYAKDREALSASIEKMLDWDFERVVVGHGEPITVDAKQRVTDVLQRDGLLLKSGS